jgi:periplasmic protein CpxP/Spy
MNLRHILTTTCLAAALAFGQAGGGPNPEQRLQKLATELNLSDDQKSQLKPILEEEGSQMKALRDDSSLSRRDRMQKMQTILADSRSKMDPILNDEQKKKLVDMRSEMRQGHRGRR